MSVWLFAVNVTTSTFSLASMVAILVGMVLALAGAIYGVRYKASYEAERATSEAWKSGREAQFLRAERLERERTEAIAENGELKAQLARLEALPNLEQVMAQFATIDRRADERERRAEERHKGQLLVLDMIAERLGPNGDGAHG